MTAILGFTVIVPVDMCFVKLYQVMTLIYIVSVTL